MVMVRWLCLRKAIPCQLNGKQGFLVRDYILILCILGDTEEMTLTVNFDRDLDASDAGGALRKDSKSQSNDSLQSAGSIPPPLPVSIPPSARPLVSPGGESYYSRSADEASEIDDDLLGRIQKQSSHVLQQQQQQVRAKSADRDSDYSELTSAPRGGGGQLAHSLDSIPDDSGYHDPDNRILKDKIAYLEAELKTRDEQLVELNETRIKVEALVKVKSQVSNCTLCYNVVSFSLYESQRCSTKYRKITITYL